MNGYEKVIALLVHKLGGDVTIGDAELGEEFELEMQQHPTKFAYKIRVRPKTLKGELVETTPVTFRPGRLVRLTRDVSGVPAGAEGMLSGEVLVRDPDRLVVVINPGDPCAPDHRRLKCAPQDLEWKA